MITRTCLICQKEFLIPPCVIKIGKGRLCSRKCQGIWQSKNRTGKNASNWQNKVIMKTCLLCKKGFATYLHRITDGKGKYCSARCYRQKQKENNILKECIICHKILDVTVSKFKTGRGKYCSQKCLGIWMSKNCLRENAAHWMGGLTSLYQRIRYCSRYKQWRTTVYQRDNYTCQICGQLGGKLHADHIYPFSLIVKDLEKIYTTYEKIVACELLWMLNNGRTLCVSCHKKTDTYLGKARTYHLNNL